VKATYPEYSIGGWIIMLGCWSSGLRPMPSAGAGSSVANGLTPPANSISPVKKAATPAITAVA
jgi:hypothetical protein